MNDVVIRAEGVSKLYKVGQAPAAKSLRDALSHAAGAPARKLKQLRKSEGADEISDFWALRDISFEVNRGDVVGIVGRNGAGKSTLLKVLSRITDPTEGSIELQGRVASLLEVGTGFHPDLTGRENIFLNGAILGMQRAEIAAKFDEIVAFAEVERFVDTQVKNYSSGMYLRLAFAVAAHLEPEILVVDEVLAVGDANFQKKCLGKMQDVAGQGRTVLFVSHNLVAVEHLCSRAILLNAGKIEYQGSPSDTLSQYLLDSQQRDKLSLLERTDRQGDGQLQFSGIRLLDEKGQGVSVVHSGMNLTLALDYVSHFTEITSLRVTVGVFDQYHQCLFHCWSESVNADFSGMPSKKGSLLCRIPHLPLNAGFYNISLACVTNNKTTDKISEALVFQVIEGDFFKTGKLPPANARGMFLTDYQWSYKDRD